MTKTINPRDRGRHLSAQDETSPTVPPARGMRPGVHDGPRTSVLNRPGLWRRMRYAICLLGVAAGTLAALALSRGSTAAEALPATLFVVTLAVILSPQQTFRRRSMVGTLDSCARAIAGCAIAAMLSISGGAITGLAHPDSFGLRLWLLTSVLLCVVCAALGMAERYARARGFLMTPTLIVGAGVVGTRVARRLADNPLLGLNPIGFLEAGPLSDRFHTDVELPVLGIPADAVEVAAETGARHVIFAFSWEKDYEMAGVIRRCQAAGLEVTTVPRLFESINGLVTLDHIGGLPLMSLRPVKSHGWRWTTKYAFDRLFALSVLLVLAPVILAIALAVRVSSPGPVVYRQRRVGRHGREFDLLKFRSMMLDAPAAAFSPSGGRAPGGIEGADRRTRIGRWLRNTSLDELPQLWNVVRGEMSLVGPRPERPGFVARFSQEIPGYGNRHRVKPGITGWAQVNGLRGQTSIADRVEWDNYYIENWSVLLELRTILLTVEAVLCFREDKLSPPEPSGRAQAVTARADVAVRDAAAHDEAVLVVGPQLRLETASRGAEQMLGVSAADVTDLPITDLLVDATTGRGHREDFVAALTRAAVGEGSSSALVRPRGAFGVRIRANVSRCGAARDVRIVLEDPTEVPVALPVQADADKPRGNTSRLKRP